MVAHCICIILKCCPCWQCALQTVKKLLFNLFRVNSRGDWIRVQVKLVWVYELQQCDSETEMGKNSVGVSCPWLRDDRELMYSVNMCVRGFLGSKSLTMYSSHHAIPWNWKRSNYIPDVAVYILLDWLIRITGKNHNGAVWILGHDDSVQSSISWILFLGCLNVEPTHRVQPRWWHN